MRIKIQATNIKLTTELKDYAAEKIISLERFLPKFDPDSIIAEIELEGPSRHHRKGEVFRCEVNLSIGGKLLRAEERGELMTEAIDGARDEIERQVRKKKEKERTKFLRGARKFARRLKLFRPRR